MQIYTKSYGVKADVLRGKLKLYSNTEVNTAALADVVALQKKNQVMGKVGVQQRSRFASFAPPRSWRAEAVNTAFFTFVLSKLIKIVK